MPIFITVVPISKKYKRELKEHYRQEGNNRNNMTAFWVHNKVILTPAGPNCSIFFIWVLETDSHLKTFHNLSFSFNECLCNSQQF